MPLFLLVPYSLVSLCLRSLFSHALYAGEGPGISYPGLFCDDFKFLNAHISKKTLFLILLSLCFPYIPEWFHSLLVSRVLHSTLRRRGPRPTVHATCLCLSETTSSFSEPNFNSPTWTSWLRQSTRTRPNMAPPSVTPHCQSILTRYSPPIRRFRCFMAISSRMRIMRIATGR